MGVDPENSSPAIRVARSSMSGRKGAASLPRGRSTFSTKSSSSFSFRETPFMMVRLLNSKREHELRVSYRIAENMLWARWSLAYCLIRSRSYRSRKSRRARARLDRIPSIVPPKASRICGTVRPSMYLAVRSAT